MDARVPGQLTRVRVREISSIGPSMRRPEALLMKRLLLLSILALASPMFAQNAMFRGNPEHTGAYGATGVPKFSGLKWQFHTKGQVLSSPAIADDKLYFGSSDHSLYALDLATGALKWRFKSDGRITSSPAVSGGVVYFGSFDSSFYAVDAATGQLKWKFQTGGERRFAAKHLHGAEPASETMPDPFDFYLSSPVIWNGPIKGNVKRHSSLSARCRRFFCFGIQPNPFERALVIEWSCSGDMVSCFVSSHETTRSFFLPVMVPFHFCDGAIRF